MLFHQFGSNVFLLLHLCHKKQTSSTRRKSIESGNEHQGPPSSYDDQAGVVKISYSYLHL